MSSDALKWAWDLTCLEPEAKFTMVALAERADEEGFLFPSVKWVMRRTGYKDRTVRGHLALFRSLRLLESQPHYREDGGQTSNRYRLALIQPGLRLGAPPPELNAGGIATGAGAPLQIPQAPPALNAGHEVVKLGSKELNSSSYTPEFEKFWDLYPKRAGNNPKPLAFKAWKARLKVDVPPDAMIGGGERYAAFIRATDRENTEYVMMAATFLGPACPFDQAWSLPKQTPKKDHDPWWVDDAGIDRKGKELGLKPLHAEDYPHFKARIWAEIRKREAVTA